MSAQREEVTYFCDGTLVPGDVIVHRQYPDPYQAAAQPKEKMYLFLEFVPSVMVRDCEHVQCLDLENRTITLIFSRNFGKINLTHAYEWYLLRDGQKLRFREDCGYP